MIVQESLSNQVLNALWELIITKKIKPNEPLRETRLSSLLNISRTPLREALQKLEWEDIVVSEPRKGYRLANTTEQDVLEIYPLRAKLEPLALELSGIPPAKTLQELSALNHKMSSAKSHKKVVEIDEEWHLLLISNCSNKRLLKMIKNLQKQSKRYEYTYFTADNSVEKSVLQHEKILTYLKNNDLKNAIRAFEENIMVGVDALIQLIKSEK